MKKQLSTSKNIDLRGISCPVNAVRAKQAISAIGEEELIEVILDAGESLINAVRSINDAGYRIVASNQLDDAVAIVVGKRRTVGGAS